MRLNTMGLPGQFSLCVIAACFPATLMAQDDRSSASGSEPLSITIYNLSHSLTSPPADRAEEEQRRIPGSTSVVRADEWDNRKATTMKDMLDFTPGVIAQPRNGAEAMRLSIRGSGLTRTFQGRGLLLMQDEIPINTADGSFDFQAIDPWAIRYMQVYKGANALAYGASTLGGAINMVTPTGLDGGITGLQSEGGSFGTAHMLASHGGRWNSQDAYASLTGFHQDGYRRHNRQDSLRFAGNTGWKIDPELETRFYFGYVATDAEIPGSQTRANLLGNPKAANTPNVAGDFARGMDIVRLANKTAWTGDSGTYQSTLFWSYRNLDSPTTTYILNHSHDIGERLQYISSQGPHQWRAGINLQYGATDEVRNANSAGSRGALVVVRDQEALTTEQYVEYDHALTRALHVIGSLQNAYAMRRIEETFPARAVQRTNYFGVSPRIGTRYDIDETSQLFANLSRSFEPPTLSELSGGNTPGFSRLHAQNAITAEIGARRWADRTQFDIAFSRAWVSDEFITYRFPGGDTASVNAKRTLHDVLELGVSQRLGESLFLQNAYTWSYMRLDGDALYGDNRMAGIPEHYLRTQIEYRRGDWSIAPNIEWVPEAYPIDFANTLYTHPYVLYGLRASYRIPGTPASLYIDGRNLFNRTYIATTGTIANALGNDQNQFFPGEGRAVYMGLRLNW